MATLTTQRQGNLWTSSPSADIPDEEHLEARRDELGPTRGDLDEAHGVIELRQLVEHRTLDRRRGPTPREERQEVDEGKGRTKLGTYWGSALLGAFRRSTGGSQVQGEGRPDVQKRSELDASWCVDVREEAEF